MSSGVIQAVLGIDAAWTAGQPSGVALAALTSRGWQLVAAESSYLRFQGLAETDVSPEGPPSSSLPEAPALLAAAQKLCGRCVGLVAVDMPLSHAPITGRRESDNQISRFYGAKQCVDRPGPISTQLRQDFELAGYPLKTLAVRPPGLIEVYPHPALVELVRAPKRLP